MRHVALVIETSHGCGRALLEGVARYNREKAGWSICFEPHGKTDQPPAWLRYWQGDGVLVQIRNRRIAEVVRQLGVPAVDLRGDVPGLGVPYVGIDFRAVAKIAFQHLYERGIRHFGFCSLARGQDGRMDERGDAFEHLVRRSRSRFARLHLPTTIKRGDKWGQAKERIARWIDAQPKPLGVMTGNDAVGLQVLDTCHRIGVPVPDQVAVLGSGNDRFLCDLSIPSQTSIDIAGDRVGYQAAALLDRLMSGKAPPKRPVLIQPRGIVIRQSTDVLATDDVEVIRAVRFIRRHACDALRVADVLDHVALSRGALEPRMKRILGRTIDQEIRRTRIDRVKELLVETEVPIKQIAQNAGFRTTQYLTRAFRKSTGATPAQYRREVRSSDGSISAGASG